MDTLLSTKAQVRDLLQMPDVIDAVDAAFRAFSSGQVEQPEYMGLHLEPKGAEIDFKAALDRVGELVSLKASSGGFTDNPPNSGCQTAWVRCCCSTPAAEPWSARWTAVC